MLPTLTKTWRFAHDTIAAGATLDQMARYVWWAIFNVMRGQKPDNSGALAWTDSAGGSAAEPAALFEVESSGNGVTAGNNDDVNHIAAYADVVGTAFGEANAHSYYVFRHPSGFRVCSRFINETFGGLYALKHGWLSSILGFGSANGGADGTATASPTALDETQFWANGTVSFVSAINGIWLGNPGTPQTHAINVWASSDGLCWRIIISRNGYTVFTMIIDVPQNPVTLLGAPNKVWNGAEQPYYAMALSAVGDTSVNRANQWANWAASVARGKTHLGSFVDTSLNTAASLHLTTEYSINVSTPPLSATGPVVRQGVSNFTNQYPLSPIGLMSRDAGLIGRVGLLTDLWFGPDADTGVSEGDNYPGDASRTFIEMGVFLLPWDTTVPVLT